MAWLCGANVALYPYAHHTHVSAVVAIVVAGNMSKYRYLHTMRIMTQEYGSTWFYLQPFLGWDEVLDFYILRKNVQKRKQAKMKCFGSLTF